MDVAAKGELFEVWGCSVGKCGVLRVEFGKSVEG